MTKNEPSAAPARIGPYEIERYVGGGGFAETFLAFRTNENLGDFRRPFCIKRLLPSHAVDHRCASEFVEEALLGSRFAHPNIVQTHDVGIDEDGVPFFAMEYVEGLDLSKVLAQGDSPRGLPIELGVEIAFGIARALDYAHTLRVDGVRQNIIHRDVKPSNVLIDVYGRVLLIDFGIALHLSKGRHTRTGTTKGTTPYMSPEHLTLSRDDIEPRSDLFCLGIVLYECLTGVNPFLANSAEASALAVARCQPEPILQLTNLPAGLAELVDQLLRRDKNERPHNARELVEGLLPYRRIGADLALGAQVTMARDAHVAQALGGQVTKRGAPRTEKSSTRARQALPKGTGPSHAAAAPHAPTQPAPVALRPVGDAGSSARVRGTSRFRRTYARVTLGGAAILAACGLAVVLFKQQPATDPKRQPILSTSVAAPAAAIPKPATLPTEADLPFDPAQAVGAAARSDPATPKTPVAAPATSVTANAAAIGQEQTATLRVQALEWGYIWVDGVYRGDTKITVAGLKPGPHLIGLASEPGSHPEESHKVVLRSGMNFKKYDFVKASLSHNIQ